MAVLTIIMYFILNVLISVEINVPIFAQLIHHHPIHRIQPSRPSRPSTRPLPPIPAVEPIPCQLPVGIGATGIDTCNTQELQEQRSFQNTAANFPKFAGGGYIGGSGYRPKPIRRRPQPSGSNKYPRLHKYASLRERDLATPRDKLRRLMKQLRPQEPKPVHLTQGMLDKYLDKHPLPDVRASYRNLQRPINK